MENPNSSAILTAAAALLAEDGSHCRCVLARDADGQPVAPSDPTAVSWCAIGAIEKAHIARGGDDCGIFTAIVKLSDRPRVEAAGGVAPWNDDPETSREDVRRALLDAAEIVRSSSTHRLKQAISPPGGTGDKEGKCKSVTET